MLKFLLIAVLLLPSCGALPALSALSTASEVMTGIGLIKESIPEAIAVHKESLAKADKDGDGELNWSELLSYLGLAGAGAFGMFRRMQATKNAIASVEGKIDHERFKRKDAEYRRKEAEVVSSHTV